MADETDFDNLDIDIANIGKFVNDPAGMVDPRVGADYPNLRQIVLDLSEQDIGESAAALINARLNPIEASFANSGAVVVSGTLPPIAGSGLNNNGYSVVDGEAFSQAGVLSDLAVYSLLEGWVIPFVATDNGNSTYTATSVGVPTKMVANSVTYFPDFAPVVAAGQHVGFFVDVNASLAADVTGTAAGKSILYVGLGLVGTNTPVAATGANQRIRIGWSISAKKAGDIVASKATARAAAFALGSAVSTINNHPVADGSQTIGNNNFTCILHEPASADGILTAMSVYCAGGGIVSLMICRRLANGDFTVVQRENVARSVDGGLNTFTDVDLPIKRGDFIGLYDNGASIRSTGTGYFYYIPGDAADTSTPSLIGGVPSIGGLITPVAKAERDRAKQVEASLQGQFIGGASVTQGYATDGSATISGANLTMFAAEAISKTGLLTQATFYAGNETSLARIVVAEKNDAKQYTGIASVLVPIVAGANTVALNIPVKAGQFVGLHAAGAFQRIDDAGGPGASYVTGVPGINTAETGFGDNWKLALGWTVKPGVSERIDTVTARLPKAESALSYRASSNLAVAIVKGTKTGIGWDGQSNSISTGSGPVLSGAQPYSNVMYSGGNLVPLVSVGTEKSQVAAANFASRLRLQKDGTDPATEVLFSFTVGAGGASIDPAQGNNVSSAAAFTNAFNQVRGIDAGARMPIVNWVQGETDIGLGMTKVTYSGYFTTAMDARQTAIRTAVGDNTLNLFIVMMQPSANLRLAGANPGPVLAQLELAQTNPRYFLTGAPMYRFPTNDQIHLNGIYYKLQGAYFAKANAELLAGRQPQWLNPRAAEYDGKVATVYFDVPVGPMFFDPDTLGITKDQGFVVLDNGVPVTISSLRIEGNRLVITCAANLAGPVKVRGALDYRGGGNDTINGASCTLRDSDPTRITIDGTSYQLFNCSAHFELTTTNVAV